jgi:hypothetical protein
LIAWIPEPPGPPARYTIGNPGLLPVAGSRTYLIVIMRLSVAARFSGTTNAPLNASTRSLFQVSNTNASSFDAMVGCAMLWMAPVASASVARSIARGFLKQPPIGLNR